MVRALLEGRKTQTRRIVQETNVRDAQGVFAEPVFVATRKVHSRGKHIGNRDVIVRCPYGEPGDRLWGKETAIISPAGFCGRNECGWTHEDADGSVRVVQYLATSPNRDGANNYGLKATPSIYMPRWASRITLEITEVRVQRLQEISEEDARAEGVVREDLPLDPDNFHPPGSYGFVSGLHPFPNGAIHVTASEAYRELWESINGPGSWGANPWVWAVSFKVVRP